ncbi:MAG: hypothetical protein HY403_05755 [Elusimicrobia bacterium]|nr:hypothetical protein [Elusimicrobiota bacterium]
MKGALLAAAVLASSAAAQTENHSFVVNEPNLRALAAYACSGLANIQTEGHFPSRLLLHRFNIREERPGLYRISGECARELVSPSRVLPGMELELLFDGDRFGREDKPAAMGKAGDWIVKFYFEPLAVFEDGARFRKVLARMTLSKRVSDGIGKLMPKDTVDLINEGLEKINASSLSFMAQWHDPAAGRSMRVEGIGRRWLIALTAWQNGDVLLMNAAPLADYGISGRGRPSGGKGNAVYFGKDEVLGCSYFSDRTVELLSEAACFELWSGVGR